MNLANTKAPDKVYFPVMGKTLHYAASWNAPLTITATILYFLILIAGIKKKMLRWTGIGLGILAFLINVVASAGFTMLLFQIIRKTHPEYSLDPHVLIRLWQPHFSNDSLYLLGFIALTVAIVLTANSLFHKKARMQELTMGALFFWLIGAIVSCILIPASGHMFQWPLLFTLAAMGLTFINIQKANALPGTSFFLILAATSVLALWIPLIYTFYLWTAFALLTVLTGLVVLVLGAMIPLTELYQFQKQWIMPMIFLTTAVILLIAGHFFAYSEETIRYANQVGYWLDGDSGKANWVTQPGKCDERQISLFEGSSMVPYSVIHPLGDKSKTVLTSPAPVAPLQAPGLSVNQDTYQDDKRTILLNVTSFQKERLEVHLKPEPERLTINGKKEGLPKTFSLIHDGGWAYVRFDAPPEELDLELDVPRNEPVYIVLIDVCTGLPSFPGIVTQPPGFTLGPPDCSMSIPTDFTAVHRSIFLPREN
jgi:hypothetical protein